MEKEVLIYGILAGIATLLGTFFILKEKKIAKLYASSFISFAVGVILGVSFLELLPESLRLNSNALLYALIGIILFYVLEEFVVLHLCKENDCKIHKLGVMAFAGLFIHSLIDGLAIGLSFDVSRSLGLITTLAVISHEFPEGLISTSLFIYSKMKRSRVIWYSVLVAIATPIGAVITYPLAKSFPSGLLGSLLALTAGTFIYVAASDLIPETHEHPRKLNAVIIVFGVLFIYVLSNILGL